YQQLEAEAQEKITQIKAEAADKLMDLQAKLDESLKQSEQLQQRCQTLESERALLQSTHENLGLRLHETEITLAKAEEKTATLSQENQRHTQEQQRLHQLLHHMQANLAHYESTMQQAREKQTLEQEKERQEHKQAIQVLQTTVTKVELQNQTLALELKHMQNERLRLEKVEIALLGEKEQLLTQYHQINEASIRLEALNQQLQLDKSALQNEIVQFNQKILEAEKQIVLLKKQAQENKHTIENQQVIIHELTSQNETLRQANTKLVAQVTKDEMAS
ncbi:MAG: hypothetical protein AB7F64_08960, partial [Gammaproteobacteria bacterium]